MSPDKRGRDFGPKIKKIQLATRIPGPSEKGFSRGVPPDKYLGQEGAKGVDQHVTWTGMAQWNK